MRLQSFTRPVTGGRVALVATAAVAALAVTAAAAPVEADDGHGHGHGHGHQGTQTVRFATFNASLNRSAAGQLTADLSAPGNAQADAVAEIIQRVRPDVLLVNEFDYVEPVTPGDVTSNPAVDGFRENYLGVPHGDALPIEYPYAYVAPSNTGIPSGFDLNNDGVVGGADDAYGFGFYPGQFGMLVLSRYPIDYRRVRTFQNFRWADMPGAKLPDDPATPAPADWYGPDELAAFRLSSKSHWDVPIRIDGERVHFLVSHPTPPVFDGPEDRNGTRNFDEIRFWADYVSSPRAGRYIYDDDGRRGGLRPRASFVIAGDQNSDPLDGDSIPGSIDQLLDLRVVNTRVTPASDGAVEATDLQGGANATHRSDPRFDTADFADNAPGNLRADYVLPSRDLRIRDAGVFWPVSADPLAALTGTFPFPSSDHRLVWVDVRVS